MWFPGYFYFILNVTNNIKWYSLVVLSYPLSIDGAALRSPSLATLAPLSKDRVNLCLCFATPASPKPIGQVVFKANNFVEKSHPVQSY